MAQQSRLHGATVTPYFDGCFIYYTKQWLVACFFEVEALTINYKELIVLHLEHTLLEGP
jgi:hypothetical protein